MPLLFLLALPAIVQAQFTYTTNGGTVTIIGYTGPSGAVTIPDTINGLPVTSIGDWAFYNGWANQPYYLTSVTIPDSVTNIGLYAFAWWGLTNATLGNGLISIGEGAFAVCGLTTITIPKRVASIGDSAFASCVNLTNATLGNGLMSIGRGAFADCGLTTITIRSRVTSVGDAAFGNCRNLTGVFFEGNAPSLGGPSVFGGDSNIVYYVSGTTGWGPTFGGRPTSVWYSLPYTYDINDTGITITRYAGPGGAVTIPSSIDDQPVTSIGDFAFINCTNLTSVVIPGSVTSIGGLAFEDCINLTNVTIPNSVTSIGGSAFEDCTSLTTITIPNSVTSIGDFAFFNCTNLAGVYFRGNAPGLGSSVFLDDNNARVYYLLGTTGWGPTFGGRPTALWIQVPAIQTSPRTQTAELYPCNRKLILG